MPGLFFSPSNNSVPTEITEIVRLLPVATVATLRGLSGSSRPVGSYAQNLITNPLIAFSAFSNSTNNLPQNVSDRNNATFYASSGVTASEFLQIDLGEAFDIFQISLIGSVGALDKLSNLNVAASLNVDMSAPTELGTTSATNTLSQVDFAGNQTSSRYIRISKTAGTAIMQIAEIKVWGRKVGTYTGTMSIPVSVANPTKPKIVRVLGYRQENDGGGGEFYLDSSDIESLDDGGIIFVANNGDRWKRIIEGDYINVRWFGAENLVNLAGADQAPVFTAAIRAAVFYSYGTQQGNGFVSFNKAMKVIIPPGVYMFKKAIRMPKSLFGTRTIGAYQLIIEGNGRVELQWRGDSRISNSLDDKALIVFENYYRSRMQDIHITSWTPLEYGILMLNNGGNPTATGVQLNSVTIQAIGSSFHSFNRVIKYGIGFPANGTGGDANNDLPTLDDCAVNGAHIGFYGYGLNFHDASFNRCRMSGCNFGVYFGNVGYLRWTNGGSANTTYSDFYFERNTYPSYIIGHNAEHAGRLIDAKNCESPIYMQGIRYDSQRTWQSYAVVLGNDTVFSIENSTFDFGLVRFAVAGHPSYSEATKDFLNNVSVNNTSFRVASPRIFNASFYDNIFRSPTLRILTTAISTTDNTIDVGANHNLRDGLFLVHNGNVTAHGLASSQGYFIKVVSGTNKIKFYASMADYEANIETILKNQADITLKLAVPRMVFDETVTTGSTPGITWKVLLTDGVQVFAPSKVQNVTFEQTKLADHHITEKVAKNLYFDALATNSFYRIVTIDSISQAAAFLITVFWGSNSAVFIYNPRGNFLNTCRRVVMTYSLSENAIPELFALSSESLLSVLEVKGINTTLVLNTKIAGNYKVSILPLTDIQGSRIEPVYTGLSATPVTITDAPTLALFSSAVSPHYEQYSLLQNPIGIVNNTVSYNPVNFTGSGTYELNLALSSAFTIRPTGDLILTTRNIRIGIDYSIDIIQGATSFPVTLPSNFKFASGVDTSLTNLANAKDKIIAVSNNAIALDCQIIKNINSLAVADIPGLLTYIDANNEASLNLVINNTAVTGTVSTTSGSTTIIGTGTTFTTTFIVGESIVANSEERVIIAIASDTDLTVDIALTVTTTGVTATRRFFMVNRLLDVSGLSNGISSLIQSTTTRQLQLLKKVRNGKNVLALCPRGTEVQNIKFDYSTRQFSARSVLCNAVFKNFTNAKQLFFGTGNDASLSFRLSAGNIRFTSGTTFSTQVPFVTVNESAIACFSMSNNGVARLFKNKALTYSESMIAPTFATELNLASENVAGNTIWFSEIYLSNVEWTANQIATISDLSNVNQAVY